MKEVEYNIRNEFHHNMPRVGSKQIKIKVWRALLDNFEDAVGDHTYEVSTPLFNYLYDAGIIP